MVPHRSTLALLLVLTACGSEEATPDGGHETPDTGVEPMPDGGTPTDGGGIDDGGTPVDAGGESDTGVPPTDGGPIDPRFCTPGSTSACADLADSFDAGTATCRADGSGYDVSACERAHTGNRAEYVYPAQRDGRWSNARCNDGTPFSFRVSLTGSDRWIVSFEGGGACDGELVPCRRRWESNPKLFSTSGDPADGTLANFSGTANSITSRDATSNPTFDDANVVIGNYCSSDLWTGTRTDAVEGDLDFDLWFAGRNNARAMMEILQQRYGLADGDDVEVIVTGSSAGGNGARNNVDLAADAFPIALADHRVMLITVAGFQGYDWQRDDAGVSGTDVADPVAFDGLYDRVQAGLNAKCLALASAGGVGPGACFTGLWATRSLVQAQPAGYGMRVLDATNRTDPVYLAYHAVAPARPDFDSIADQWEALLTEEMLASGVRWLLAPAQRGMPNLHGMNGVWTTPFPAYDASSDPCDSPRPAGVQNWRALIDAFYAETDPFAPGVKVCLEHGWPG